MLDSGLKIIRGLIYLNDIHVTRTQQSDGKFILNLVRVGVAPSQSSTAQTETKSDVRYFSEEDWQNSSQEPRAAPSQSWTTLRPAQSSKYNNEFWQMKSTFTEHKHAYDSSVPQTHSVPTPSKFEELLKIVESEYNKSNELPLPEEAASKQSKMSQLLEETSPKQSKMSQLRKKTPHKSKLLRIASAIQPSRQQTSENTSDDIVSSLQYCMPFSEQNLTQFPPDITQQFPPDNTQQFPPDITQQFPNIGQETREQPIDDSSYQSNLHLTAENSPERPHNFVYIFDVLPRSIIYSSQSSQSSQSSALPISEQNPPDADDDVFDS